MSDDQQVGDDHSEAAHAEYRAAVAKAITDWCVGDGAFVRQGVLASFVVTAEFVTPSGIRRLASMSGSGTSGVDETTLWLRIGMHRAAIAVEEAEGLAENARLATMPRALFEDTPSNWPPDVQTLLGRVAETSDPPS